MNSLTDNMKSVETELFQYNRKQTHIQTTRLRKSLMVLKKTIGDVRKEVLEKSKSKKPIKEKVEKVEEVKVEKVEEKVEPKVEEPKVEKVEEPKVEKVEEKVKVEKRKKVKKQKKS
jgi:hypothetical protein